MPDVPGLETQRCKFKYDPDGPSTPSEWTAYLGDTPGGTVTSAVQTLDFDTSYVRSNGENSQQWWTLEDVGTPPTSDPIVRIHVRAMVRSDGFFIGSCRLNLGVGGDTVGAGSHATQAGWTMITDTFDLNPNDTPPAAFDWVDVDDIKIGITSLTIGGEIRCSAIWILVDTCDYTACPRCCCCCLCFAPVLRIPAGAFTYELGDDDLVCPELVLSLPFCDFYFLGGCWFVHGGGLGDCAADYDPIPIGDPVVSTLDGHTYELRLVGATMVGGVLSGEGNCARIQIVFLVWDLTDNALLNTITIGESNTTLDECEPYHQSHIDMDDVSIVPTLPVSGTIYVDCSGDTTGELPIP